MDLMAEFDKQHNIADMEGIPKAPKGETPPIQRPLEYVLYKSHLLDGEQVLVVKDEKTLRKYKSKFPGVVAYTGDEINELWKFKDDDDAIKKIHFAKKEFEGIIISNDNQSSNSGCGEISEPDKEIVTPEEHQMGLF